MARIRTLKPELLEDEKTASLTCEQWRLYVSMITMADDYGNLRANPRQITAAVFWALDKAPVVEKLLTALSDVGLVQLYSVNDQAYAHLCGWSKHQKVDHPGTPRVPKPPLKQEVTDIRESLARPSEDEPSGSRLISDLDPDQDPDQEQVCFELARSPIAKPSVPPVLVFGCRGEPETWALSEAQLATWVRLYPGIDVKAECNKALAWTMVNPQKTAGRMPRFLTNWLNGTANRQTSARGSPVLRIARPVSPEMAAERARRG